MLAGLLAAVPANAEPAPATDSPISAATAENAAPVEIDSAPVEQPEAVPVATETGAGDTPAEPAVAEEITSTATEVVANASSSATHASSSATKEIASSVPSASEAVGVTAEAVAVTAGSPSPVQPDSLVGTNVEKLEENTLPQGDVTAVVEGTSRNFTAAVEGVSRTSAEAIATATERLAIPEAELDLLSPLFDSISPLSVAPLIAEEAQSFGAAPAGAAPKSTVRTEGFSKLRQQADLLPSTAPTAPHLSLGEYLADARTSSIPTVPGSTLRHWEIGLSPSVAADMTFAGSSDERSGSPARPDLPPPAPHSPATAVGGSGGPSFVPVVALLALLALVAPTARRRLGEVADFRAPTPFVCALERPG